MDAGLHVTWFPAYGPEMRGGTANCTVVIGPEPIGSPLVRNPDIVVAMNLPSTEKYAPLVKPGGILLINASLVERDVERTDITVVRIPANHIAEDIGDKRLANMVMVGALLTLRPVLSMEAVETALEKHLPERHRHLLEANMKALAAGARFVREEVIARER